MAVESIGPIFETKIPSLTDAADIQAAFYAYHYGAYTSISTTAAIITPSIAKILLDFETDITALQAQPASGGASTSTAPIDANFAGGIPNGFIWVDEDGAVTNSVIGATSIFTDNAPTSNITSGIIWVDKDATTSTTGNPFIPQAIIAAKGDLLAGSTSDTVIVLTVGSNGQLLKADSSTASGLAWTNTLTSPVISGTTTTASGNLAVQPASYVLEVQGGGSTDGAIQLNCYVNSHGQKIKSQPHSASATNTLLLPGGNTIGNSDSVLVSEIGTQTLTNKTLTSPAINTATIIGGTLANSIVTGLEEDVNIVGSAATGTINFDTSTASIWYYTSNAGANHTLNFRHSSNTSLTSILSTGDAMTLVFLNTNGSTAFYPSLITIDGATSGVSIKAPAAITAGNTSAIDVYSFTIIKTAATSFTVLETQTKFA